MLVPKYIDRDRDTGLTGWAISDSEFSKDFMYGRTESGNMALFNSELEIQRMIETLAERGIRNRMDIASKITTEELTRVIFNSLLW